jgi:hypothetical protein
MVHPKLGGSSQAGVLYDITSMYLTGPLSNVEQRESTAVAPTLVTMMVH